MSIQAKQTKEKAPKRAVLSLERKNSFFGYIFTLPIIIGLAVIYLPILIQSLVYSFSKITIVPKQGYLTEFLGFQNYYNALYVEEGFLRTVIESTIALLPQIFVIIIFAFFMANILNQEFKGRTIARVIFFIPVVVSTGIMAQFENMNSMLDLYSSGEKMEMVGGAASALVDYTQLQEIITSALNNPNMSSIVLGAISGLYGIITSSGVQMLVFLSGLQGISINMYEAAKVEGATGWEVFWKISFPMISPLILVNLIYTVIDLFLKADNEAINFINNKLADGSQLELASALSWIYTLVILLFVGIVWMLVKKLIVYQD